MSDLSSTPADLSSTPTDLSSTPTDLSSTPTDLSSTPTDPLQAIGTVSKSVSKQIASLFLGAVTFAVAMSWNYTVQATIKIWTPKDDAMSATKQVQFNVFVSIVLTLVAVGLAALLTHMYGKQVGNVGQASMYGLIAS